MQSKSGKHSSVHFIFIFLCLAATSLLLACEAGEDTGDFPDGDATDGDLLVDGDEATDGDEEPAPDGDADSAIDGDTEDEAVTDGDESESDVEIPGLLLAEIDGLTPLFDYEAGDFFSAPYPNDIFIEDDGTISLPGFTDLCENSFVEKYSDLADVTLTGFSNNAAVYWPFPAPIDPDSLPQTSTDTMSLKSPILLLNVDPDSPELGELTPVEFFWRPEASLFEPENLLTVAPFDGFPLLPATTYAMILTDGLKSSDGEPLGRNAELVRLLSGAGSDDLTQVYAPLIDWLMENTEVFDPEKVRAATVFTTQDPIAEMKTIHDYIAAEYPDGAIQGDLVDCRYVQKGDDANTWWFEGHYTSPNFQSGEIPYAAKGGSVKYDEEGLPIIQATETLDFALSIPPDMTMPEDGWPIVMIAHGTGGDYNNWVRSTSDGSRRLVTQAVGLAAIGIDQPLHGNRGGNLSGDLLELYSFNFMNPESGRYSFIQSAADTAALTQLIKSGKLVLDKTVCESWPSQIQYSGPDKIIFDPEMILFHGHSHGGLSGAIAAAFEDDVKGWVLSGAGGRMSVTMMERTNPDVRGMVSQLIGIPLEEVYYHHPMLSLVQMLTDNTDPINYAPYWIHSPFNERAKNVFVTSGFLDEYTPKRTAEAMATAGRVPHLTPVEDQVEGLLLREIDAVTRPASNNVAGPDEVSATAGFSQYPDDDHFPVFNNEDAIKLYQEFLRSIAYDDAGVLGYE